MNAIEKYGVNGRKLKDENVRASTNKIERKNKVE